MLREKLSPAADALVTDITVRHAETAHGSQIRQVGPSLTELTAFQSSVRRRLQALDAPGAEWEIAELRTIIFRSEAALAIFKARSAEVEPVIAKVNQAAEALGPTPGPK